jgi:hypothetical protein
MNIGEYDQLVGLVETWWGPESIGPWRGEENYELFAELPVDPTYATLIVLRDGGRYSDWPPKPPALRVAVLDLLRHSPEIDRSLPEPEGERYDWAEFSTRVYGEVIGLDEAVRLAGEALGLGVAPPSISNPWRRPDPPAEDAPGEPGPGIADPEPADIDSGPDTGIYEGIRDVEPPEEIL